MMHLLKGSKHIYILSCSLSDKHIDHILVFLVSFRGLLIHKCSFGKFCIYMDQNSNPVLVNYRHLIFAGVTEFVANLSNS